MVNGHGYSEENAEALKKEVLYLLNHPTAIQRKARLQTGGAIQFEVASATSKNGTVQVSVFSDHATCVCGRYKHDSICKHSLAVATLMSILCVHLDFIKKKSRKSHSETALAEYDVRKTLAGKKGAKNKYPCRPARGKGPSPSGTIAHTEEEQANTNPLYTEIYHNPFILMLLTAGQKDASHVIWTFVTGRRSSPLTLYFHTRNGGCFPSMVIGPIVDLHVKRL